MSLNCGGSFVKYLLCFFNFLLFIVGGALLAVSIWVAIDNTSFFLLTKITDNTSLQTYNEASVLETGAYILIVAGGILFLLGFLGCCGAAMESRPLLAMYGVLIIFVFLLEITAGVLLVIYKHEVENHLEDFLKQTLRKHYTHQGEPNAVSITWDSVMVQMHCCGVNNFTDFELASRWQENASESGDKVPRSCCILQTGATDLSDGVRVEGVGSSSLMDESCLYEPTNNNSYYLIGCLRRLQEISFYYLLPSISSHHHIGQGCHERLKTWAEANANCLLGIAGGVGVLEVIVCFLAFCLCSLLGSKQKCQNDSEDQQALQPNLDSTEEEVKDTPDPDQKKKKKDKKEKKEKKVKKDKKEKCQKEKDSKKTTGDQPNDLKTDTNDVKTETTTETKTEPKASAPPAVEEPKPLMKAEFDDFDDIDKVED